MLDKLSLTEKLFWLSKLNQGGGGGGGGVVISDLVVIDTDAITTEFRLHDGNVADFPGVGDVDHQEYAGAINIYFNGTAYENLSLNDWGTWGHNQDEYGDDWSDYPFSIYPQYAKSWQLQTPEEGTYSLKITISRMGYNLSVTNLSECGLAVISEYPHDIYDITNLFIAAGATGESSGIIYKGISGNNPPGVDERIDFFVAAGSDVETPIAANYTITDTQDVWYDTVEFEPGLFAVIISLTGPNAKLTVQATPTN